MPWRLCCSTSQRADDTEQSEVIVTSADSWSLQLHPCLGALQLSQLARWSLRDSAYAMLQVVRLGHVGRH